MRSRQRIAAVTMFVAVIAAVGLSPLPAVAAPTATVMVQTQRMSDATLKSTQAGWYSKGSVLTLTCFKRGMSVKGYYSPWIPGAWDNLWYKVSDGYFVADVDINTGSNNPVTAECGVTPPPPPPPAPLTGIGVDTNSWYTATVQVSNMALDARGASAANGTAVQQYPGNGSKAQKWRFIPTDGGFYRLATALSDSQILDVSGASAANGARLQLWGWAGGANQQWMPVDAGGGYITFRPRHATSQCLDVPGGSTSASAQLQIYSCNGSASQRFKLSGAGPIVSVPQIPGRNGFAYPVLPSSTLSTYGGHNGDDFTAGAGQAVYAMGAGTVKVQSITVSRSWCPATLVPTINGAQKEIILTSVIGGKTYVIRYAHFSSFAVANGATVAAGQLIGYAGNSGCANGVHVHIDVTANGARVYPRDLLGVTRY